MGERNKGSIWILGGKVDKTDVELSNQDMLDAIEIRMGDNTPTNLDEMTPQALRQLLLFINDLDVDPGPGGAK